MSADTNTSTNGIVSDNRASVHETAVAEIVEMITAKYTEEGARNFAIGKRAFEHAQWQKGSINDYGSGDFDKLMSRIRDEVRIYVSIKAESIRVSDWTRCHVLRELVRAEIADAADSLSMFEYLAIVGKALHFTSKDLEGSINEGWLDMIRGVAAERSQGTRVTREDFTNRIQATVKRIADAKAALNPAKAALEAAATAVKKQARDAAKATEDITTSLSDGLAKGAVTPEAALSILENVAKAHGKPLPANAVGFDPASCTLKDCELLALAMFSSGKYTEMVALRDKLDKMVSAIDKARAAGRASEPAKVAVAA
ncbi:hypothetical protein SAMN05444166_4191 [Singulisphaera sp. GP187]|uniref:hypothetical protein n=1 Tax=Singulisphaera sp. GP187 TaxID=1882752 RepID=UPI00092CB341|nr:hypothetical protein [Singulisphaera sp. GP187]SIO37433.1 hypothetical protein SAMN05444166_4191 [Singulisphaera sp. GP187]